MEREAGESEAAAITDHRRPRGHCGPGCLLSGLRSSLQGTPTRKVGAMNALLADEETEAFSKSG